MKWHRADRSTVSFSLFLPFLWVIYGTGSETLLFINIFSIFFFILQVRRLTAYVEQNRDLLAKVAQRQEVWHAFRELERKAKDPSR